MPLNDSNAFSYTLQYLSIISTNDTIAINCWVRSRARDVSYLFLSYYNFYISDNFYLFYY